MQKNENGLLFHMNGIYMCYANYKSNNNLTFNEKRINFVSDIIFYFYDI